MSLFTALMLIVLTLSLGMAAITLIRLYSYDRKNRLPESKYTKLFTFITKEHLAMLYIIFNIFYLIITVYFILSL